MGLALQGGAHLMVENKFVKLEKTLGFHDFHFSNSTSILNVCEFLLYEDKDVCTKRRFYMLKTGIYILSRIG